jgi:hypothetical protein
MSERLSPEELVNTLRAIQRHLERGIALDDALAQTQVARSTYFRWKRDFGGLDAQRVREIRQMAIENARLRRYMADLERGAA